MKILRNIVVLFLASSLFFLTFKYISFLRENISRLEGEKQSLIQEVDRQKTLIERLNTKNTGLKNYLKAANKRLNKSFSDLDREKLKGEELKSQFSLLKAENDALSGEKARLVQENEDMKEKFNSIDELKKAIRALKQRIKVEGNQGFIVKHGQPTSVSKVKIEVTPASDNK